MTELRRPLGTATSSGAALRMRVELYAVMLAKGVRSRMSIEITHAELSPYWYLILVTDIPGQAPLEGHISGESGGGDAIGALLSPTACLGTPGAGTASWYLTVPAGPKSLHGRIFSRD